MVAFTLPIINDKSYLVIPRPGTTDTLGEQTAKVLRPFDPTLWGLVVGIIAITALLSVWFSDTTIESTPNQEPTDRRALLSQTHTKTTRKRLAYARLGLDSFLQKGLVCLMSLMHFNLPALLSTVLIYDLFGLPFSGFLVLVSSKIVGALCQTKYCCLVCV